jgi:peptide-methionine (S)-S-oxide reductase
MSQLRFLTLVGTFLLLSGLTFVAVRVSSDAALAAESGANEAVPKKNSEAKLQKAFFAAGCFWHVEDSFRHVKGVAEVTSGYTGGNFKNPSYRDVCSGQTHHAEAVEVDYDPSKVSYGELLNTFWQIHDPTTLNAQGPDHGEQYRSAIFFVTPEQKALAIASRDKLAASGKVKNQIVTQILPASDFYRAEEYHQRYFEKHGAVGCAVPIRN